MIQEWQTKLVQCPGSVRLWLTGIYLTTLWEPVLKYAEYAEYVDQDVTLLAQRGQCFAMWGSVHSSYYVNVLYILRITFIYIILNILHILHILRIYIFFLYFRRRSNRIERGLCQYSHQPLERPPPASQTAHFSSGSITSGLQTSSLVQDRYKDWCRDEKLYCAFVSVLEEYNGHWRVGVMSTDDFVYFAYSAYSAYCSNMTIFAEHEVLVWWCHLA